MLIIIYRSFTICLNRTADIASRFLKSEAPGLSSLRLFLFFCQRLTLFPFPSLQRGKDEYKLAATSEDGGKKDKKAKAKKDMDDLKKEVDLVSTECLSKASL